MSRPGAMDGQIPDGASQESVKARPRILSTVCRILGCCITRASVVEPQTHLQHLPATHTPSPNLSFASEGTLCLAPPSPNLADSRRTGICFSPKFQEDLRQYLETGISPTETPASTSPPELCAKLNFTEPLPHKDVFFSPRTGTKVIFQHKIEEQIIEQRDSYCYLFPGFERVSTPELNRGHPVSFDSDLPTSSNSVQLASDAGTDEKPSNLLTTISIGSTGPDMCSKEGVMTTTTESSVECVGVSSNSSQLSEYATTSPDHNAAVEVQEIDLKQAKQKTASTPNGRQQPTDDDRDYIGIYNDQGVDVTRINKAKIRSSLRGRGSEDTENQDLIYYGQEVDVTKLPKRVSFGLPEQTASDTPDYGQTTGCQDPNLSGNPKADASFDPQQGSIAVKPNMDELCDPREEEETHFRHRSGATTPTAPNTSNIYTNLWNNNAEEHKATRTFVNDREVFYHPASGQYSNSTENTPALPTNLKKLHNTLWDTGSAVDRAINSAQRGWKRYVRPVNFAPRKCEVKETEFGVDTFYYHNPPHQAYQYDNSPPGLLSTMTETVYRALSGRYKSNAPQHPINPPDQAGLLREGKVEQIGDWIKNDAAVDWEEADYFIACTTAQLKELNGETLDRTRVVKVYIGPPTSPTSERAGQNGENDIAKGTENEQDAESDAWKTDPSILPPFVPFQAFNPHSIHKDLSRLLGIRQYGIQVLGTKIPENYSLPENQSDYYSMPILESPEQSRSNYIVAEGDPEDDNVSITSSNYDQTQNVFYPIHTQVPAQSLILYLRGKSMSLDEIAAVLGPLDEKWVYKWNSRWWNGFRVPDHWEFSDDMVNQIKVKCKAESQWWEGEFDKQGKKISPAFTLLQSRMRVRKAAYFVKKVLENYFWWRCRMGERCHKDILSG